MPAFRSAAFGCAATIPASTNATMRRSMERPRHGSPPMSVPHLDTRVIGGQHSLLFGPYAGFSTRFLKHGSLLDLVESVRPANVKPLLSVARDNIDLTEYLVEQVLQVREPPIGGARRSIIPAPSPMTGGCRSRGNGLRPSSPTSNAAACWSWELNSSRRADRSLVALLGASPGASTAAFIAISVLEKCFPNELTAAGWLPKLKEIIPSYGVSLKDDADFLRRMRADTAAVLKIENI